MATKNNPGDFDCYAAAEPDEPMFILLGRDPHASRLVEMWIEMREEAINNGLAPVTDQEKIEEAFACIGEMQKFREEWMLRKSEIRAALIELVERIDKSDNPVDTRRAHAALGG